MRDNGGEKDPPRAGVIGTNAPCTAGEQASQWKIGGFYAPTAARTAPDGPAAVFSHRSVVTT